MNMTKLSEQFGAYLYHRLPKVYRDYDVAIDRRVTLEDGRVLVKRFYTLEEYLRSFAEGGFQPLLEDIEAIITLIDPMNCPEEYLPLLLQHFGLDFIEDIPVKFQRRLVQNIVTLYRKKGTIPAVAFLARELSGFDVTIEETDRGGVQFALVKLNAYEDEKAELLLAQEVVQRYIHLFLPTQAKAEIIVTYGFTEGIHINSTVTLEEYAERDMEAYETVYDHVRYDVTEDDDSHAGFIWDEYFYKHSDLIQKTVEEDFNFIKISHGLDETEFEDFDFHPFDISSLTNMLEEGDFVYTNGVCCEDSVFVEGSSSSGELELAPPQNSVIKDFRIVAGEVTESCLVATYTSNIDEGAVIKLTDSISGVNYSFKSPIALYGNSSYPTHFVVDKYNKSVKVYNHCEEYVIDGSFECTPVTGYNSFKIDDDSTFYMAESVIKSIGATSDSKGYYGGGTVGVMYVYVNNSGIFVSKSDITTAEAMKEYLQSHPITLIVSSCEYRYTFFEKYLEVESQLTPTVSLILNSDPTYLSQPRRLFHNSVGFVVEDSDSAKRLVQLPVTLCALNGKSDYIERVNGRYYIYHWIDYIKNWNIVDFKYHVGFNQNNLRGYDCYHRGNSNLWNIEKHWHYSILPQYVSNAVDINNCTSVWSKAREIKLTSSSYGSSTWSMTFKADGWDWGVDWWSISDEDFAKFKNNIVRAFKRREELSDIKPHLYYERRTAPRVEEITDKVLINKLNLLSIPDNYVKIYSKDIPFSEIEVSVESKMYY